MERELIDQLWQQAMRESIEEGEQFTRYHFAKLVAAHERERLYGKDIDTLLFEEHRLAFEKGKRAERTVAALTGST